MTTLPRASVIMPCHNAAATLPAQLDMILPQLDDADAELILVDNNSTDRTRQILESLGDHPRVTTDVATGGQGVAYARNAAVGLASSNRFLFCDADDIASPNWISLMSTMLDEHEIVTGSLEVASLNSSKMEASRGRPTRPTFYQLFPVAHGGNLAVTRSAWTRIGNLDEGLPSAEDIDWSLRARLLGIDIAWLPEAEMHYRYRSDARSLWSQGLAYGRSRPPIAKRAWEATGVRPPRLAGLRSWLWLALHAPAALVSKQRRPAVAWVAGNRLGQIEGSLRSRFCLL